MKLTKTIIGVLVLAIAAFAFQDASLTKDLQPIPPSILSDDFEESHFTRSLDIKHDVPDITAAYPEEASEQSQSEKPAKEEGASVNESGTGIQTEDDESDDAYWCNKTRCFKV